MDPISFILRKCQSEWVRRMVGTGTTTKFWKQKQNRILFSAHFSVYIWICPIIDDAVPNKRTSEEEQDEVEGMCVSTKCKVTKNNNNNKHTLNKHANLTSYAKSIEILLLFLYIIKKKGNTKTKCGARARERIRSTQKVCISRGKYR